MTADSFSTIASNDTEKYVLSAGRIARRVPTKDGSVCLPLCNFSARIRDEVAHDDGEQVQRLLTIEGETADGRPLPTARVDAAQFAGMRWVAANWGAHAIIDAGQGAQDHLRAAIQYLSRDASTRRVYTHTGWHILDGRPVFLTAGDSATTTTLRRCTGVRCFTEERPGHDHAPALYRSSVHYRRAAATTLTRPDAGLLTCPGALAGGVIVPEVVRPRLPAPHALGGGAHYRGLPEFGALPKSVVGQSPA